MKELRFDGTGDIDIWGDAFAGVGLAGTVKVYCAAGSKVYDYFIAKDGFQVICDNTIRYVLNGGKNDRRNPGIYTSGAEVMFYDPTRTGYTFEGWYTNSALTDAFVYDKDRTNGDITLYAKWSETTYQITYELDGGTLPTGKTNPDTYTVANNYTLIAPAKAGCVFVGWKVNDTETIIKDNRIAKGSYAEDLALTALWEENTYQIIWERNAKDATGTMEPTLVKVSEAYTIPAGDYDRPGYDIYSWNTSANGKGKAYAPGDVVQGLATTGGATVTLYAQWQQGVYDINYELNGGTNHKSNPDSYTVNQTITLKNPTREGYAFAGWYTDDACTQKVTRITSSMGDVTVYAGWTANSYTITFNKNKGTGTMDAVKVAYDESVILPTNAFARTGYSFAGWNTKANGTGTAYADGEAVTELAPKNNAKVTLYAQWTADQYAITYILNDDVDDPATNPAKNPAYVTIERNIALSAPTRNGYKFAGWYTDEGLTTALARNTISRDTTAPVTVYAAWTPNTYTLRLDKNGGSYTIPSGIAGKYAYTDEVVLPDGEGASRASYTLTGWNTRKDRSGAHYDLGTTVRRLAAKGTVTLYAEWTPDTDKVYTITYHNVDDWDNSQNPTEYSFEKDAKLVNPTRVGYTFQGWYAEDRNENPKARKVTSISRKDAGDKDLYGVWSENSYTIAYNANKGTLPKGSKMMAQTVLYSEEVTLTANAYTRKGYHFAGWNTKANGTGESYTNEQSVRSLISKNKGRVTLYAQWAAIPYTITYVNVEDADNAANPATYTVEKDVALRNPTRNGYTFKGWYAQDPATNAKARKITRISRSTAAATTVYALWSENSYNVRFSTGGLASKVKSITNKAYTTSITIPLTVPTRYGYTFSGWAVRKGGEVRYHEGDTITFASLFANGAVPKGLIGTKYFILYAVFTPNS